MSAADSSRENAFGGPALDQFSDRAGSSGAGSESAMAYLQEIQKLIIEVNGHELFVAEEQQTH